MSNPASAAYGEARYKPSIDDMISLRIPQRTEASPDGTRTAFTVRTTNWRRNQFESKCHVHEADTDRTHQLTRSGDVTEFHWINNESLAVLRTEDSEKGEPQVWLFEGLVGEGFRLTEIRTGVQSFKPFANGILFLADDPEKKERKTRGNRFGSFVHFEQDDSPSALYYTDIDRAKEYFEQAKKVPEEEVKELPKPVLEMGRLLKAPLKIVSFAASSLGDAVYLNCRSRDDLVYQTETRHFRIRLDPTKSLEEYMRRQRKGTVDEKDPEGGFAYIGQITELALPKGSTIVEVSPDGRQLLVAHKERDNLSFTQSDLWTLDLVAAESCLQSTELPKLMRKISQNIDRDLATIAWTRDGIYVSYQDHVRTRVAKLSLTGEASVQDFRGIDPASQPHLTQNGVLTFVGTNARKYFEVYKSSVPITSPSYSLIQLTSYGSTVDGWDFGTLETIRWKSRDGADIEGVLRKPFDFDPKRKYPLVLVVHGGPRAADSEYLLHGYDYARYPSVQFVNKNILVLKPNYRGSTGRGQAFTELNKENLGVGDLWDLESAIDYLDSLGIIDTTRVGCMWWSQGGYISAFATTHSDRFTATSVGAGISDWYTYHISNDIPYFTTDYLSGTPFKDRSLYVKTAPMSAIAKAKTPTLIQHGAKDQRVPLSNATELYRGLKDMHVPVELFIYPEMAHPITKPRENRAVMHQNLTWFSHYLLGEKLDLE